jgi:cytochrome c peroxidase
MRYAALILIFLSYHVFSSSEVNAPEQLRKEALTYFSPLTIDKNLSRPIVLLGQQLFSDKRLSHDDSLSCMSCHDIQKGGVDGLPVSVGIRGQKGGINSPTVLNSSLNFVQFWNGRAASLEEQAAGPVENPIEMGETWSNVLVKLSKDAHYQQQFKALFPKEGMTKNTIVKAISDFERSLITLDSPFDRFLQGDLKAMTAKQQKGLKKFMELGCIACHQGVGVGGSMYQKMGLVEDYFSTLKRPLRDEDYGLYQVTKKEEDKHFFKVPMLRNVALTAPYFHDGSAQDLPTAIKKMAKHQLGVGLAPNDVVELEEFLRSLTGKLTLVK